MATTQYIGARYVPRHMGEWDVNTQYGALDVVLYTDGNSYTAKCYPPKGTVPTNDKYWSLSAQFNQQLAALLNDIERLEKYEGGYINFKTFGGSPDNDDNSPMLATAITQCASAGKGLFIDSGEYLFKSQIVFPIGFKVVGVEKPVGGNYGTILKKDFSGDFVVLKEYAEIGNICIDGGDNNGAAVVLGSRSFINNACIQNSEYGLICGVYNCNLSRVYRTSIVYCDYAMYFENTNETNAVSMSFHDIDIRECGQALYMNQPNNKFYNFSAQGITGEQAAITFGENGNGNIFCGYYLESGNGKTVEVDFSNSKYNKFTGGPTKQYENAFANNDGTNTVEVVTLQNDDVSYTFANKMLKSLVIPTRFGAGGPGGGVQFINGDENELCLKPFGTSATQKIIMENVAFDTDTFAVGAFKSPKGGILSHTFDSFPNNSTQTYTASYVDINDPFILTSRYAGVLITAQPSGDHWDMAFSNVSGKDLSGVAIPFSWFSFKTI